METFHKSALQEELELHLELARTVQSARVYCSCSSLSERSFTLVHTGADREGFLLIRMQSIAEILFANHA